MSEIVAANIFFSADRQTGIIGGTSNTFSIIAGNTTSLIANSSSVTLNNVSFASNSSLSVSSLSIGNSSVKTTVNSTALLIGSNLNISTSSLSIGNSSVKTTVNSTALLIGSNLNIRTSSLSIGNSSVNAVVNSSSLIIGNTSINTSIISINDLRVNTINAISGSTITIPTGTKLYAPGSVIQVVQTIKKDTWASSGTGATTYYDVTGFTANITPTSANSKILVNICVHVSSGYYEIQGRLTRNNTAISDTYGNTRGSRTQCSFVYNRYEAAASGYGWQPIHYMYLDSPANTSTQTYGLHLNPLSGYYVAVNYNVFTDSNFADYNGTPSSTITLMEIAQ